LLYIWHVGFHIFKIADPSSWTSTVILKISHILKIWKVHMFGHLFVCFQTSVYTLGEFHKNRNNNTVFEDLSVSIVDVTDYFFSRRNQTWGQLLSDVIDYITITLQFSWLHNYITSVFHWNVTIWLVMKWSHDYKSDVSHPNETQIRTCTCLHDDVRCKQSMA
jgi:hypothetical protein